MLLGEILDTIKGEVNYASIESSLVSLKVQFHEKRHQYQLRAINSYKCRLLSSNLDLVNQGVLG